MGSAFACGKVILAGEHFVVHGTAALALPILSRRVQIHVDRDAKGWDVPDEASDHLRACLEHLGEDPTSLGVRMETTLPIGAGLGGSAAMAVALTRALSDEGLDEPSVRRIAHDLEHIAHGSPSGIDDAVATYGCPIFMSPVRSIEPLTLSELPRVWVAVSAQSSATRDAVARVAEQAQKAPGRFEDQRSRGAELVARAHGALLSADWAGLGDVMNQNHDLLVELGVSTPGLDALTEAACSNGAFGAKLTGAGCGGAVIAVAPPDVELEAPLRAAGAKEVIAP